MKRDRKRVAAGAAIIKSYRVETDIRRRSERLSLKECAAADQLGIIDDRAGRHLHLVARVSFKTGMADGDRSVAVMIKKVDPVGNIIRNVDVVEDPVSARLVGPESITVTSLVLAVAVMRHQPRISLAASAPHDAGILEPYRAAVGRSIDPSVAVPSDEGIGNDIGVLDRPVRDASRKNTGTQAVNIQIFQKHIIAVGRHNADQRPGTVRIGVAVALSRGIRPAVHTAGMVGDVKALDFHIAAAYKIQKTCRPFRSPQLRFAGTSRVPSFS